jgi:predicted ATPase
VFGNLKLYNWRQFARVEIAFHSRLTVLTGANGSGKTTILHLLNRHWGWNLQYVSTPRWDKRGARKYWGGFWDELDESAVAFEPPSTTRREIGRLTYEDGQSAVLRVPENVAEVFAVEIHNQVPVNGVYVPSHRPPYVFQRVDQIPTQLDAKEQIFQTYLNELMARFAASGRTQSPSFRIKSSLISLATFGYGNRAVDRNEDAVRMFEGFEAIMRVVLPSTLGFERLRVRVPDILLDTTSGVFSFDAVSGGVAAIIDLAWQIYMYRQLHHSFVVVIDEPETHLHPALQQRLIPDLLAAFPECQFIVATHNPFMVTSVIDSNVYVLTYNSANRVESSLLDTVNKAASADEVLRDVLGVPHTLPVWAHVRLQEVLAQFTQQPLSEDSLIALRKRMADLGLEHLFPSTLARVVEGAE